MTKSSEKNNSIKLSIKGLSKTFGNKIVLNDLNLDVNKGESLVVIGGSGTGKSVMLKCILGLMKPESGSVHVEGQEITSMKFRDREKLIQKFGMLFPVSYTHLTLPTTPYV